MTTIEHQRRGLTFTTARAQRTRPSAAYLDRLRAVPMFATSSQAELRVLARSGTITDVRAGTVLCREDEIGREFGVVIHGHALVTRQGRAVATLGPGDFFGELSLLDRTPRDATVVAASATSLFVMTPLEFSAVLTSAPSVTQGLLVGMARRLHDLDRRG